MRRLITVCNTEGARVLCVEGTLGQDGRFEKVFVGRVGGACNGVCGRMYR